MFRAMRRVFVVLYEFFYRFYRYNVLFLADYRYDDWHSEEVLNVSLKRG